MWSTGLKENFLRWRKEKLMGRKYISKESYIGENEIPVYRQRKMSFIEILFILGFLIVSLCYLYYKYCPKPYFI
jgi:hypothetical protein